MIEEISAVHSLRSDVELGVCEKSVVLDDVVTAWGVADLMALTDEIAQALVGNVVVVDACYGD